MREFLTPHIPPPLPEGVRPLVNNEHYQLLRTSAEYRMLMMTIEAEDRRPFPQDTEGIDGRIEALENVKPSLTPSRRELNNVLGETRHAYTKLMEHISKSKVYLDKKRLGGEGNKGKYIIK